MQSLRDIQLSPAQYSNIEGATSKTLCSNKEEGTRFVLVARNRSIYWKACNEVFKLLTCSKKESKQQPWQRPRQIIYTDFMALFMGTRFLVVHYICPKWPRKVPMTLTSASHPIDALKEPFSRTNALELLMRKNGAQFEQL